MRSSSQQLQVRHLRHIFFSQIRRPLHLRTVIFSQKPDDSHLPLRVEDVHLLRHNGHFVHTGRQSTQMLWHLIGLYNVSSVSSSKHTGQHGSSANLCSRVLTATFATGHTSSCIASIITILC
jgi:hypothetical protein